MSPHDLSGEEVLAFGPESKFSHNGVFQAAFLDGHAKAIPQDIDRETLRGILTIAGGEEVSDEFD
jgi:prepilin-type processing-associated H-X9-DG protein